MSAAALTAAPFFHVGYVVADLEAAMAEFGGVPGVSWQAVVQRPAWRRVFSSGTPPLIELIEGEPGTPWDPALGTGLHHVGKLTYDLNASIAELTAAGLEIAIDGREISGPWAYFALPRTSTLFEVAEADDTTRRERYGLAA